MKQVHMLRFNRFVLTLALSAVGVFAHADHKFTNLVIQARLASRSPVTEKLQLFSPQDVLDLVDQRMTEGSMRLVNFLGDLPAGSSTQNGPMSLEWVSARNALLQQYPMGEMEEHGWISFLPDFRAQFADQMNEKILPLLPGDVLHQNVYFVDKQEVLQDRADLARVLSRYPARVFFAGHGSKSQYGDLDELRKQLDQIAARMNGKYGRGKWLAMFGGDSFNPEKPDIAFAMKYLEDRHGVPLLAVQSDVVKGWGGIDRHVRYVFWVPTAYVPLRDSAGQPVIENGKPKMVIVWGGFKDGVAVGPTSVLLDKGVATEMVALGGGPIARDEYNYAQSIGLPVSQHRLLTRYPEINGPYGSIQPELIVPAGSSSSADDAKPCGDALNGSEGTRK
jgi:hypothetical protein